MSKAMPQLSPVKLFLKVIALVFLAEAGVMVVLDHLPKMSEMVEAVVDAGSLSLILAPCFWWWLVVEARRRQSVEKELEFQRRALDCHALVSETDASGRITYASDLFCAVSGYTREELLGQKHNLVNSGYHPRSFWKEVFVALARDGIWHGEVCNRAKDGHLYWVASTMVSFRDPDGKISRYVSIRTEITKRKEVEEQLQKAREVAEAANRAKGDFLAVMSHEIRTPMNGVLGFTDLLLDTPLNKTQQEFVQTIQHSGNALLTLINDILDYSKIEAGKLTLELMPFNLREACEDVLELIGSKATAKGLEIALLAEPGPIAVVADPGRIRQVLTNLVGNAIKFTSQGSVRIEVLVQPPGNGSAESGEVSVRIVDTGIGISADKQSLLFQKFIQADASTTRKFGGTGLGLAISKQLIETMGGKIGIESEEGKGTTFWFTLPLPNYPVELPAVCAPASRSQRVLIATDSPVQGRAVSALLNGWQISHGIVANAEQAVGRLRTAFADGSPYNTVLVDVRRGGAEWNTLLSSLATSGEFSTARKILCQATPVDSADAFQLRFPLIRPKALAELFATTSEALSSAAGDEGRKLAVVDRSELGAIGGTLPLQRVLVAEDTVVNQRLITHLLRKLGLEADLAGNGRDAVEKAMKHPYPLILMDCQMPEMDGFEATRQIRASQKAARVGQNSIVIALTANAVLGDREECLAAGMDDYLSKPIQFEKLKELVRRYLEAPQSSSGSSPKVSI